MLLVNQPPKKLAFFIVKMMINIDQLILKFCGTLFSHIAIYHHLCKYYITMIICPVVMHFWAALLPFHHFPLPLPASRFAGVGDGFLELQQGK
jgi:hypothetical protein